MAGKLEGKVAVVVGAGAPGRAWWGTGRATAVLLAREGAKLVLFDRDEQACRDTEDIIREEGGSAIRVRGDVMIAADLRRMVDTASEQFGRLDILVNNVGITAGQGLLQETEEAWDTVFSVNVKSVFMASKYAVPAMLKNGGGCIVNVSSIAGIRITSMPPSYGYLGSKAALLQVSKAIAAEFASRGIRCNCIIPGMLDTAMVRNAYARAGFNEERVAAQITRRDLLSPTGKQGTAWDVAHAALFLVSDEANYINGTELLIDGGFTNLVPS